LCCPGVGVPAGRRGRNEAPISPCRRSASADGMPGRASNPLAPGGRWSIPSRPKRAVPRIALRSAPSRRRLAPGCLARPRQRARRSAACLRPPFAPPSRLSGSPPGGAAANGGGGPPYPRSVRWPCSRRVGRGFPRRGSVGLGPEPTSGTPEPHRPSFENVYTGPGGPGSRDFFPFSPGRPTRRPDGSSDKRPRPGVRITWAGGAVPGLPDAFLDRPPRTCRRNWDGASSIVPVAEPLRLGLNEQRRGRARKTARPLVLAILFRRFPGPLFASARGGPPPPSSSTGRPVVRPCFSAEVCL